MSHFPKKWKFKKTTKFLQQKKLCNTLHIIGSCTTVSEALLKIKRTKREISKIEQRTKGQSEEGCNWFYYRSGILTGTSVYRAYHAMLKGKESAILNKAISKRVSTQLHYPAIVFGRDNEKNCRQAFYNHMKTIDRGFQLHCKGLKIEEDGYIGGSVDDICSHSSGERCVVEYKCSYKLRDSSVKEGGHLLPYLTPDLGLNKNHRYYFQLLTYMYLWNVDSAYFVVYTPKDILVLKTDFDEQFWGKILSEAFQYYKQFYLPSLISG